MQNWLFLHGAKHENAWPTSAAQRARRAILGEFTIVDARRQGIRSGKELNIGSELPNCQRATAGIQREQEHSRNVYGYPQQLLATKDRLRLDQTAAAVAAPSATIVMRQQCRCDQRESAMIAVRKPFFCRSAIDIGGSI